MTNYKLNTLYGFWRRADSFHDFLEYDRAVYDNVDGELNTAWRECRSAFRNACHMVGADADIANTVFKCLKRRAKKVGAGGGVSMLSMPERARVREYISK